MEECAGMPIQIINAFQNTSTGGNNLILDIGKPTKAIILTKSLIIKKSKQIFFH